MLYICYDSGERNDDQKSNETIGADSVYETVLVAKFIHRCRDYS